MPLGSEHPADGCRGVRSAELEDQVVASGSGEDVLARVVDDVVGAETPYQLDVGGAADAGDLSAQVLGDLDGEGPDSAGGADDQDVLPSLETAGS